MTGVMRPKRIELACSSLPGCLEGKTDENGRWSFAPPKKTDLRIVINAGAGHKGEWTVRAEELSGKPAGGKAEPGKKPPEHRPASAPAGLRKNEGEIKNVIIGLSCIAALTALGLAVAANRRLSRIEKVLEKNRK